MYEYKAKIDRVIDGDTVEAVVDLGFGVSIKQTFRLLDIDAPETRGSESVEGDLATKHLEDMIGLFKPITIKTRKDRTGKYGRYLCVLYGETAEGPVNLNARMVSDGHAEEA